MFQLFPWVRVKHCPFLQSSRSGLENKPGPGQHHTTQKAAPSYGHGGRRGSSLYLNHRGPSTRPLRFTKLCDLGQVAYLPGPHCPVCKIEFRRRGNELISHKTLGQCQTHTQSQTSIPVKQRNLPSVPWILKSHEALSCFLFAHARFSFPNRT